MWSLYLTSKTWRSRPSEVLVIEDPFVAACFDEVVRVFGMHIEGELSMVEGKTSEEIQRKSQRLLLKMLGESPGYADPAALAR